MQLVEFVAQNCEDHADDEVKLLILVEVCSVSEFQFSAVTEDGSLTEENSRATEGPTESVVSARKSGDNPGQTSLMEHLVVMRKSGSSEHDSKRTSWKEISTSHGDDVEVDAKEAKKAAMAIGALTVKEDRVEGEVTVKTYIDFCRGSG